MNLSKQINNVLTKFGTSGPIKASEIINLLDKGEIVFYREKYGFIRIITGYNISTKRFFYRQAPLRYSCDKVGTYWNLGADGWAKDFEEIEYFSEEIRPIKGFWSWFLMNIKGMKYFVESPTKE